MSRDWFSSFNDAATGLVRCARSQRNLRYHLLLAFVALALSFFLNISRLEFLIVVLVIGLVIVAELVNSAVEGLVDLVAEHYHPLAKTAKDVAAGSVLVASVAALTCGYVIFVPKMERPILHSVNALEKGHEFITALTLLAVVLVVVVGKASFGKGQILRGGMPSGHAAVSFCVATTISLLTKNVLVMFLSFFLALLVAQSRLIFRIHSLREVLVGAAVGTLITVLIFQLIR